MSEFQEVMRQFDRMCKAHGGCVDCPLAIKGTLETKCSVGSFVDEPEYIEREVMAWAAEHPEPVYPTWSEWLVQMGVFPQMMSTNPIKAMDAISNGVCKPIPADMAQKLGIEPKGE